MATIKTIIFDLGGVLIDWNPEYVFKTVIPDDERRAYFFEVAVKFVFVVLDG